MKVLFITAIAIVSFVSPAIAQQDGAYKPSATCKYQKELDAVISHAQQNIAPTAPVSKPVQTGSAESAQG